MTSGTLTPQASADPTELEFALETESGFLVVLKGTGNDGHVTLAIRRRVGTPPSNSVSISADEVKRLVNVLGELSPGALKESEKHSVVRQRDAHLDHLMGSMNEPVSGNLDLFIERDFPELANRRKRTSAKSTAWSKFSNSVSAAAGSLATGLMDGVVKNTGKIKIRRKQVGIAAAAAVGLILVAISSVAIVKIASHKPAPVKTAAPAPAPSDVVADFSRAFVLNMLTFKTDNYRQAQVKAMAAMTPELAQKYWQETGFPLTKKQLKAIPQDQEVAISSVNAQPISVGCYQVDVLGSVTAQAGATNMPLHIRLTVNKDANGKLTVSEQSDLSTSAAK